MTKLISKQDSYTTSHPIYQTVDNAENADFGSITYQKGGSILRMVESMIGKETLYKGLGR